MTTTDKDYTELLARLGIKPKAPMHQELIDELGDSPW